MFNASPKKISINNKKYRPDIDGLRALAVLSVVFFHINPLWVPGGFIGVDIFFVISGYLITGNILREAQSPRGFSWKDFYRRRALRILPVLFTLILVTLFVAHFVFLPTDLEKVSWSALASTFASGNIYFTYFLDTSYFADDSNLQPLLHLWSLGVEEQFYFFWPVILILIVRSFNRTKVLLITLLLLLSSFVLAEWLIKDSPMFAYYMLPTRAGELLVGAILAIWLEKNSIKLNYLGRQFLSVLGLFLIIFSLIWIDSEKSFPGFNAFPSTLGAALIIWAGYGKSVGINRLLSFRLLVFVGLISYSLYLWHWPVLSFYRYAVGEVTVVSGVLLLCLMLVLSVLSYKVVEKPSRRLQMSFKDVLLKPVGAGVLSISVICLSLFLTKGFGFYYFDEEYKTKLAILEVPPTVSSYPYVCQRSVLSRELVSDIRCVVNGEKESGVLLWGDSNAGHYIGVIGAFAEEAGFSFRNVSHNSCPPLLSNAELYVRTDVVERCLNAISLVRENLFGYQAVILGGAWDVYSRNNEAFFDDLEKTIDSFLEEGKKVIVLGVIPKARSINRLCTQKSLKKLVSDCVLGDNAKAPLKVNAQLKAIAKSRPNMFYYDVEEALCSDGKCEVVLGKQLVYHDRSHLSMEGSWLIGHHIINAKGVPDVFLDLDSYSFNEKKWLVDDKKNINLLPLNQSASKLKGNIELQFESDGIRLSDLREDGYDVMRYNLPLNDRSTNVIYLKTKLEQCSGAYPLVRLRNEIEGARRQYDLQLDCDTGAFTTLGELKRQDVKVQRQGNGTYELFIRYDRPVDSEKLSLFLFPASGTSLGKYTKGAVGSLLLTKLEWSFEKDEIVEVGL